MIIEELKKEQVANEVKMFQYATGGKRKKTVKKYREVEERLQHLKTQLTSGRKLPPVWRFSILYFEVELI